MYFIRYQKIYDRSGAYDESMSSNSSSDVQEWLVQEKIHGCNFSIYCGNIESESLTADSKSHDDVKIQYAKRNGFLNFDKDCFYEYQQLDYILSQATRRLWKELNENIHDIIKTQQPKQSQSADFEKLRLQQIVIYGELFGNYLPSASEVKGCDWKSFFEKRICNQKVESISGKGDHTNVSKLDIKIPVQEGVYYSNELQFVVFDVAVLLTKDSGNSNDPGNELQQPIMHEVERHHDDEATFTDSEGRLDTSPCNNDCVLNSSQNKDTHQNLSLVFLPYDVFAPMAQDCGFLVSEVLLKTKRYEEAINFDVETMVSKMAIELNDDLIAYNDTAHTELQHLVKFLYSENFTEGVVIRPAGFIEFHIDNLDRNTESNSSILKIDNDHNITVPPRLLIKRKNHRFAEEIENCGNSISNQEPLLEFRTRIARFLNLNRLQSVLSKDLGHYPRYCNFGTDSESDKNVTELYNERLNTWKNNATRQLSDDIWESFWDKGYSLRRIDFNDAESYIVAESRRFIDTVYRYGDREG